MIAIFTGKLVYHKDTKGPYDHSHTFIYEDAEGNLFVWTRVLGAHASVPAQGSLHRLEGTIESIVELVGGRKLTKVTRCKVLDKQPAI